MMWARVKGKTENALARLPFSSVTSFRPGAIQAVGGTSSRTPAYRALYLVLGWLFPLARALFPGSVTTTENIGLAMLHIARTGEPTGVLESPAIEALAARARAAAV